MLPAMPPWVRYVVAGVIVACFAYALTLLSRIEQVGTETDEPLEAVVQLSLIHI